jgi:hypothetical protein
VLDALKRWLLPETAGWSPMLGYAATIALGVAAGWLLHATKVPSAGPQIASQQSATGLRADARLQATLETAASGAETGVAGAITPVLTFRDRAGAYCRQYEMTQGAAATGFKGVACRSSQGQWIVQAHGVAPSVKGGGNTGFRPASGAASGPAGGLVESAVSNMIDGDAFGASEEKQLIGRGWR